MARKKTKKLSKVAPSMSAPNQVGTVELHAPGIFGARMARIRTDEEAAHPVKAGTALQKMLGDLFKEPGIPPHGTGNIEISLARNREIQQRLVQRAQAAAEHVWPGFNALMKALIERENEFVSALGQIGHGVA